MHGTTGADAEQGVTLPADRTAASRLAGFGAIAALFAVIVYLEWGTGLATDDFVHILYSREWRLSQILLPDAWFSTPLLHYTHGWPFYFLGDRPLAFDLLKSVYLTSGVYFSYSFFQLFCPPRRAVLMAFLFIFLPLHEAAVYSLIELYLVESFTCYLFAYALAARGRFGWGILFAMLGSFLGYGSSPIAFGLTLLALLQNQRKLALAMLIPNLIYVVYYLTTSLVFKLGTPRLIGEFGIVPLAKQMFIQLVTFIDATVGPSAWAKIFYSISSITLLGCIVALAVAAAAFRYAASEPRLRAPVSLLVAAAVIVVLSFGMFSLTGLYPQITFNIGNRIMIYGSFFLLCLFAVLPVPRLAEAGVVVVLLVAVVGISDHWKQWYREVEKVGGNIRTNKEIRSLPADAVLYVSGHQYSRLGPFSHIDFLTADYVARAFFKLRGDTSIEVYSFNRRLALQSGELLDRKFAYTKPIKDGGIWLYDTERNVVERVELADIQKRLDVLPEENRHWIQMLPDGWIRQQIRAAVPRLSFAF